MIYDIKWWNGFKAIFRDPNATTADFRGIRHRSAYVRNLVGAEVHWTTTWTKFYPTYHFVDTLHEYPTLCLRGLSTDYKGTYLILSTQLLNDPLVTIFSYGAWVNGIPCVTWGILGEFFARLFWQFFFAKLFCWFFWQIFLTNFLTYFDFSLESSNHCEF